MSGSRSLVRARIIALCLLSIAPATACKSGPGEGGGTRADASTSDSGTLPASVTPDSEGWWRGAVMYEIFVRSFHDSNGDGIGDLAGIIEKLDVLNDGQPGGDDLGVDGLWLMPIHPSPSYHGYDVLDYRGINPQYGTLEDMDRLIQAAHDRGMKMIIDFVLNHSSVQHPWFVDSARGPSSPRREWYSWRAEAPQGWRRPWDSAPVWHLNNGAYYYALFWSGMPDLNLSNPEVEAEMHDSMRFWLERGVDGFRVDAARHLFESEDGVLTDRPENHVFSKRMRAALQKDHPQTLLVAEAWSSLETVAEYRGDGDEYSLAFSFDLASAIKTAVKDGLRVDLVQALSRAERAIEDRGFEAPFLANHDMPRVMRDFAGEWARARIAAAILFAMPGTPFVYYGEEIGMQGGALPRDEDKRTPMRWSAAGPHHGFSTVESWYGPASEAPSVDVETQRADPGSLWRLYQRLIALRKEQPGLRGVVAERVDINAAGKGAFALLRRGDEGKPVLFVANLAAEPTATITATVAGAPSVLFMEGLRGTPSAADGKIRIEGLEGRGFAFIALDE